MPLQKKQEVYFLRMYTKMAEENLITVDVPSGIEVKLEGTLLTIKGTKGTNNYNFDYPGIKVSLSGNSIKIECNKLSKKINSVMTTFKTHMENMIDGVTNGFKCKLKIVYSHFPITLRVAGNVVEILNFLGEKAPRKAAIVGNTKVSVTKEEVVVDGINKENVGQTASNIEQAIKIRGKDTRVFQDGIYIVQK